MKQQTTCRLRNNSNCNCSKNNSSSHKKDLLPLVHSSPMEGNNNTSISSSSSSYYSTRRRRKSGDHHNKKNHRNFAFSSLLFPSATNNSDHHHNPLDGDLEKKQHQMSVKVFALSLLASFAIAWAVTSSTNSHNNILPATAREVVVSKQHHDGITRTDSDTLMNHHRQHQHHSIKTTTSTTRLHRHSALDQHHDQLRHHDHHHHDQPPPQQSHQPHQSLQPDAIVVGSGLAGLAATLTILDRGGSVVLLEKEATWGGNSVKASSGINACCLNDDTNSNSDTSDTDNNTDSSLQQQAQQQRRRDQTEPTTDAISLVTDTLELFQYDTTQSAGRLARPRLIQTLTNQSAEAVEWLRHRVQVDLSQRAQLGGHSAKRTFRPAQGMVGIEIIFGMQKAIQAYHHQTATTTAAANNGGDSGRRRPRLKVLTNTKVTRLLTNNSDGNQVVGVAYTTMTTTSSSSTASTGDGLLYAPNVILATGGFAADRSRGSLLEQYRPDLMTMATTAGAFSQGDGMRLASTPSIGAQLIDMEQVQVHPTGFVDPTNPSNPSKILAAEVTRGMGGILLHKQMGRRFCNELGKRDYVSNQMLAQGKSSTFALVLSSAAAEACRKHVDFYANVKHLMTRLQGVDALAQWMGTGNGSNGDNNNVTPDTLRETLQQYRRDAQNGIDEFGKNAFRNLPAENLDEEVFYAGTVTPVVHYCMGGLAIDTQGQVLKKSDSNEERQVIAGLHAAGEVTGGVHGVNRLGGNSLLECAVFGRIVGNRIPIHHDHAGDSLAASTATTGMRGGHQGATSVAEKKTQQDRVVSTSELAKHNTPEDCWVALYGEIYDLTRFAPDHKAGSRLIHRLAGKDGTETFEAVHDPRILKEFLQQYKIGSLEEKEDAMTREQAAVVEQERLRDLRLVSKAELQQHASPDDCWIAIHGIVYDLTSFAKHDHLGGPLSIQSLAGTDGTQAFDSVHSPRMLESFMQHQVGKLQ